MSDTLDLVGYLTGKGLQVHRAAGNEVTVHCIFCPDGDPKGKGKLYLNSESWLYDCKRCMATGNRTTLLAHYGDVDDLKYAPGTDPSIRRRVLAELAELAHEMLLANDTKLQYLLDRGLTPETILEAKLGYVPSNVGISRMLPSAEHFTKRDLLAAGVITLSGAEFFNNSLTIPYFSHGQVVQVREKKQDGKYRTAGGDHARLYNADALRSANDVIITEGEYDALALQQHLAAANDPAMRLTAVVGLPGAGAWPDDLEHHFTTSRRVFIGLDPDDTGRQYAAKLKQLLGTKARILELPRQLPKCDWTDYLNDATAQNPHGGHGWRDVQRLVIEADLAGKRMFSIAEAAAKWTHRVDSQPGIKLGWPSVDSILRPGIKPGQVLIPLAKTGTGKSVFVSNIVHNTRDRRCLHLSLEMTAAETYEHLYRIHRFNNPGGDTPSMLAADYSRYRIVDQNRMTKGDLATLVGEYTDDVGDPPELIIVDYLGYYARGFPGSGAYEKVSEAAMEIKAVAKDVDAALIVPGQVNRSAEDGKPLDGDDARDSGVIEETADFLLSLYRPDAAVNIDGTVAVQTGTFNVGLLKSRHGGKGRVFNMRMSNLSLAIVDTMQRVEVARVDQENALYRQGLHYEDYRRQIDAPAQLRLA